MLLAACDIFPERRHISKTNDYFLYGFDDVICIFVRDILAERKTERAVRNFVGKSERKQNVRRVE